MTKSWNHLSTMLLSTAVLAAAITARAVDDDTAQNPPAAAPPAVFPTAAILQQAQIEAEAARRIRRAMGTPIMGEFVDTPLRDALDFFSDLVDMPILLDISALDEKGVPLDMPIMAEFEDEPFEPVLNRILDPLGLTWLIRNEVLLVTTIVQAEEFLTTRVYDVRKLLAAARRAGEPHVGLIDGARRLQFVQFGGGMCAGHGQPAPADPDAWLPDLIQNVTSGPWQYRDGTGGTLSLINQTLVVRHTRQVHDEVDSLLQVLTRLATSKPQPIAMANHPPNYPAKADADCYRALQLKSEVEFIDTPLRDAVDFLSDLFKVRFFIDKPALAEEGLDVEVPITLNMNDVTAHSILRQMLEPHDLGFAVRAGMIHISTQPALEEIQLTVAYDVRDLISPQSGLDTLIATLQQETTGPWLEIDGTGGAISPMNPGMLVVRHTHAMHGEISQVLAELRRRIADRGDDQAAADDEPAAPVTRFYAAADAEQAAALKAAIEELIAPESWQGDGGGMIRMIGTTLAVRQTPRVHAQIQQFVDGLHAAEAKPNGNIGGGLGGGSGGGGVF